ncbi:hypothetical protein SAMN04488697_11982 [Pseudomonas sp. 43mfcvi1.1]|nr:hypothetical protein ATJ40_11982 [Pseudomonas sp. 43mfcvi1.1]SSB99638.1 hypothetical protein SAMN04488697_11982 [Pseudomonas sp. 43mfcvi1.1]
MVPLLQRVTFGKAPKVTKNALPHHSVPRLGSACPHSGIAPWTAAKGHPWPSAAIPASMPGCPLRNACVRPAWFNGASRSRSRSRSRSKAKQSKAKQSKAKPDRDTSSIFVAEPPLSRADSLPHGLWVLTTSAHDTKLVGAGLLAKASAHPTSPQIDPPLSRASPLPQEKRDPPKPGRLPGRLAVDVDLGRPVNHDG